ncbi:hypothetical protein HMI54_003366 [Coelomomyces lativittatus]|nr:hypothetical protein HMI54_003366 [Coelomomyces lativittatus]
MLAIHAFAKASPFSSVSLGMDTTPPPLPDSILSLLEGNTKHWNVETLLDLYLLLSEGVS